MSDASTALLAEPPAAPPPAADPPAAAAPAVAAAPASAPAAAPPAAPTWLDGLDDDGKKFVEAKGFKSAADALKVLRESAAPETPDAYELPVPEGEDPAFSKAVAPLMHKAGLSPAQARALAEGWNEMQSSQRAAAAQQQEASEREASALAERQDQELRREWGEAYAANAEHGKRAVNSFLPGDAASKLKAAQALEQVVGYAGMMKMWAQIGSLIKEDSPHGMGGSGSSTQSAVATRIYDQSNMNP